VQKTTWCLVSKKAQGEALGRPSLALETSKFALIGRISVDLVPVSHLAQRCRHSPPSCYGRAPAHWYAGAVVAADGAAHSHWWSCSWCRPLAGLQCIALPNGDQAVLNASAASYHRVS
jgi:hypothetical protein